MKAGGVDNPFAASSAYRPLTPQAARRLMSLEPALCELRRGLYGRVLPRLGYEVQVAGHWLANEGGTYYFKHPEYLKESA